MKTNYLPLLLTGFLLTLPTLLFAQMGFNSPAGVIPRQDIEMYSRNGFLMQQKYTPTTDAAYPVYTMNCATNLTTATGILLDPGGTGDYPANQNCSQVVSGPFASSVGYEITFGLLNTEANGDSVIIRSNYQGRVAFSGNTLPPVLLAPGSSFTVTFKSDNDATIGPGFQLRWRKVVFDTQDASDPYTGNSFRFDPVRGSLISGLSGVGAALTTGYYSTALGFSNAVKGDYATGIGSDNLVSNYLGVGIGADNTVTGQGAIAIGVFNKSTGEYSVALGQNHVSNQDGTVSIGASNTASGFGAIAIGYNDVASGLRSVAMGNYVSTNGFGGAFILGDNSTFTKLNSTATDQFTSRFAGGYRLFSNAATTLGVQLAAGGNAWSAISDSTKKERFLPLNHTELLGNIRTLKLGTWNYKGQRDQRHYGPMAQDFFARFGHDKLGVIGCDTLLNSHDFTAVTLSGVQALALENEQLKAEIAELKRDRSSTTARLETLERAILLRPNPRTTLSISRKRTK